MVEEFAAMTLRSQMTVDGIAITDLDRESPAKVQVACDDCGKPSVVAFKSYIAKQVEYKRQGETYCRGCACKRARANGRPRPHLRRNNTSTGQKNHNFSGGHYADLDGNVLVLVAPGQYKRADHLVLEEDLGCAVRVTDCVLHIDFDKTNNTRENLALLPSRGALHAAKRSLETLARSLLRIGLLKYDRRSNSYKPVEQLRRLLGTKEGK